MTNLHINNEITAFEVEFSGCNLRDDKSEQKVERYIKDFLRAALTRVATTSREIGYELRDKEYAETFKGVTAKVHAEGFAQAIAVMRKEIEFLIANEINVACTDGFPTSRLTSLYNNLQTLLNTLPTSTINK